MKQFFSLCLIVMVTALPLLTPRPTIAQGTETVACGDVIEIEFTTEDQAYDFAIPLAPGDTLSFVIDPLGDTVGYNYVLLEPSGNAIEKHLTNSGVYETTDRTTGVLSGRGNYRLVVANAWMTDAGNIYSNPSGYRFGVGILTISLACTLRDGTVIAAGSTSVPTANTAPTAFSGFGFPGLPSVDFGGSAQIPLLAGTPFTGAITPTDTLTTTYTVQLSADQPVALELARINGNLNLGLTVLDANNAVVFYGGLITPGTLRGEFVAPNTGTYTFGVFRVDLNPPVEPVATAFSLTVTPVQ